MYYFFKIFYSTWHKAYQLGIQIQLTENWFTPGVIVRVPECDHIVNTMKIHYFIFICFLTSGHAYINFDEQRITWLLGKKLLWFVCLFVCDFTRIFYTYGDVTITGVGLQILTDAWHSLPLSCEAPLACHTYCDTGIRLYWSFPRTRDTHIYCRSISNGAVTTVFTTTVCRGWVSNTQPSACGPNALTRCATAAVSFGMS